MAEARWILLGLAVMIGLILGWGIDCDWRNLIIRCESRWLIDLLGDRAFAIGYAVDGDLRMILGKAMAQTRGSFGEGLVMGLRQILTRCAALNPLVPLLVLAGLGFFHEAQALRALRANQFTYTSPLLYRKIHRLPLCCLVIALGEGVAPWPVHPLVLASLILAAAATAGWRHARHMKQF